MGVVHLLIHSFSQPTMYSPEPNTKRMPGPPKGESSGRVGLDAAAAAPASITRGDGVAK